MRNRLDGLLQGNYLGLVPGPGQRGGGVAAVLAGRRRAPHGLAGHRAHDRRRTCGRRSPTASSRPGWSSTSRRAWTSAPALTEKRELVLAAITAIVHLTVRGGNRVGAVVGNGSDSYRIPALGGRNHARHLVRRIAATRRAETARRPGPAGAARVAAPPAAPPRAGRGHLRLPRHRSPAGDRCRGSGRCARSRAAPAARRRGPRPARARAAGGRSGDLRRPRDRTSARGADLVGRRVRQNYAAAAQAQRARIATALRHAGAAHLQLRTDRDWINDVVRFVLARRRLGGQVGAPAGRGCADDTSSRPAWLLLLIVVAAHAGRLRRRAAAPQDATSPGSATSNCSAASRRAARAGVGT